jgi:hypothetical protein
MAAVHSPDFYYVPQGFGQFLETYPQTFDPTNVCGWRYPDSTELKASIFLALAHGAKGIHIWKFATNLTPHSNPGNCLGQDVHWKCLADSLDANYSLFPLGNMIKDNIAPRLNGKLGKTLIDLDYTGNFLQLQYFTPTQNPVPNPPTYDYLTIGLNQAAEDMNWHAGILVDSANTDNKHFLLANLWTNSNKSIQVKVTEPVSGYNNYRFRNVEAGYSFDTTFTTEITTSLTHPKGEGFLYQVAPVVKYGGTLIVNDTITSAVTLIDDMIINTGVELLLEDDYTITDTITLEGTGFITGDGYIVISGNGAIIPNRWDKSLFKSRSGDYPKLIWDDYPSDSITVRNYKIYRKHGAAAWMNLTTVPDTILSYIDSTFTINPPGGQSGTEVHYKITAVYGKSSETSATNTITIDVPGGEIEKRNNSSNNPVIEYKLEQNYPNPFNPITTIKYSIKYGGLVTLKIYDILGTEVKVLVNENKETGNYTVSFNASSLPSGVYFYKIKSGKFVDVKKMILLK